MKEFKINDFLTLKLEENTTNIYVKGELFEQCKFLMVNIPTKKTKKFDEIDSLDEVADLLRWTEDGQQGIKSLLNDPDYLKSKEGDNYIIGPDTEFWGHCSNLQVWSENNYDTRLLHSNLSFPLLKKLTEVGDPIAKRVFKKEIVLRLKSGYPSVVNYILNEELLDNLNQEELEKLMKQNWHRSLDLTQLKKLLEVIGPLAKKAFNEKWANQMKNFFLSYLRHLIPNHLIEQFIKIHLGTITKYLEENISLSKVDLCEEKFSYETIFVVFSSLLEAVEEVGLIEDFFPTFLETIEKFPNGYKFFPFDYLIKKIKETGLIEEYILTILKIVDNSENKSPYWDKIHMFSKLIDSIKNTELQKRFYPQIETQFLALLKTLDSNYDFHVLVETAKHTGLIEDYFLALLDAIDKFPNEDKFHMFFKLFDSIKNTELLNKYYSQIETQFLALLKTLDTHPSYSVLIEIAKHTGLIEEYFLALLDATDKLPDKSKGFLSIYRESIHNLHDKIKVCNFSNLIDSIKGTELLNKYYFQIETQLIVFLNKLQDKDKYEERLNNLRNLLNKK